MFLKTTVKKEENDQKRKFDFPLFLCHDIKGQRSN